MQTLNTPIDQVDTSAAYAMGQKFQDKDGNEFVYLTGVASTLKGSWVTYDELGITTLLVANAIGPVAVAMAVIDSTSKFGWYQVRGLASALLAANCADNATLGRETTDGYAGDGRAAGDQLIGAISRGATAGNAALATVQLLYPSATDALGS